MSPVFERTTLLKVAGQAGVDYRTARKYMTTSEPCTDLATAAIRRALSELGIADPRAPKVQAAS